MRLEYNEEEGQYYMVWRRPLHLLAISALLVLLVYNLLASDWDSVEGFQYYFSIAVFVMMFVCVANLFRLELRKTPIGAPPDLSDLFEGEEVE